MEDQNEKTAEIVRTTEIIGLVGTTKYNRIALAKQIVMEMKGGSLDALNIHLQVKNTESLIKMILEDKDYKEICLEEAQKYGKKFEKQNAAFEIKETGIKYDYSGCNDSLLLELYAEEEALKKKIEDREKFLKGLPASGHEIRQDDELITLYPPIKTSQTSVTVSLK